jgi:hypothetical protein
MAVKAKILMMITFALERPAGAAAGAGTDSDIRQSMLRDCGPGKIILPPRCPHRRPFTLNRNRALNLNLGLKRD